MSQYAAYVFSVIADGGSADFLSSDYTFVHELGHNMGYSSAGTITAASPTGAVRNSSAGGIEAALGFAKSVGTRLRIAMNVNNVLEPQLYLLEPGGPFTEVSAGNNAMCD